MVIRTNLSQIVSQLGSVPNIISTNTTPIGRVYGVITTPNTPTETLYKNNGGDKGIGTVFYKISTPTIDQEDISKINLDEQSLTTALPIFPGIQDYPIPGEKILIFDGPSPSGFSNSASGQKYYLSSVNLWNNNQQNSPTGIESSSFIENSDLRPLLSFEGDRIYQGRKGNGIRFGTTVKKFSNLNEWSDTGNNGDPITIMVNGYVTTDTGSLAPNVEEVNKEMSSLYMTSTQKIPLLPNRSTNPNPLTSPKPPKDYIGGSQIILNSDRITINSKKDEIMVFAKTNVEITTNNIVNLNAGSRVHLNTPIVFLGTKSDGTAPTEPLLLGNKTTEFLCDLLSALSNLGTTLQSAIGAPAGSPLPQINKAGIDLATNIERLCNSLEGIRSKNNYTT